MTEKTRMKLGAYFLFALVLLTLPVSLLVTHYEAQRHAQQWVATDSGVQLKNTTGLETGIQFAMKEYGLSRDGAEKYVADYQRKTHTRLDTGHTVPYGAVLDYYTVDGTVEPNTAKYDGSRVVMKPDAPQSRAYLSAVQNLPDKKDKPALLERITSELKKGYLSVPLAWAGMELAGSPVRKLPQATTAATTTVYRLAIICTRLPGFRDISPRSDDDTDANDTGVLRVDYTTGAASATPAEVCYRQVPPDAENAGYVYNYATRTDTPAGTDEPFWASPADLGSLFDSPGGVFNTGSWGIPDGIPGGWDFTDEYAFPHASHATNLLLQNAMYDLFFDPAYSAVSCSNFFYQQTHGTLRFDGTPNDVVGWLISAHQLNRYPYQIGGGNSLFVYPGTPVMRAVPVSDGDFSAVTNQVLRATLSPRGLTVLFNKPRYGLTSANFQINAFTTADIDEASGTQNGSVNIDWVQTSGEVAVQDPYDARRWTITNPGGNTWQFAQADTTSPPSITYAAFVSPDGGNWTLNCPGWTNLANYKNSQRRGCPQLANTGISTADLRISQYDHSVLNKPAQGYPADSTDTSVTFQNRPFARLKSMAYYITSFVPGQTYQILHMQNEFGYDDDISGTSVPGGDTYRANRVYPFDHESDDPWNGGYWAVGGAVRSGSAGEYSGDVNKVLQDNGITLTGYAARIYIAADGGAATPGGSDSRTIGGFQPSSDLNNFNESGAGVAFHELAHAFCGAADLYDNDLYSNNAVPPPVPQYHECASMNKYSLMDAGGRLDAWHQVGAGYCPVTVITKDTLGVEIPEIEGEIRDPVVIKIPGNPYYLKRGVPDTGWQEYFFLENRNVRAGDGNGAYGFDSSDRGLYIYHIDGRSPARNNANQAGFQREDDLLTVIIEQADGLHELEFNNKGNGGATTTDVFGANTAARVTRFWQFPVMNGDTNDSGGTSVVAFAGGSPTSYSHGYTYAEKDSIPPAPLPPGYIPPTSVIVPGTETDSFSRVVKISNTGSVMTADVYVEPVEVVATGTSLLTNKTATISSISRTSNVVTLTTSAAHNMLVSEYVTVSGVTTTSFNGIFRILSTPTATTMTYAQTGANAAGVVGGSSQARTGRVQQGLGDVGMLRVDLENPDGTDPANADDMRKLSQHDAYIDNLYVLESGTSANSANLARVKLYADANGNGVFDPTTDSLLATTNVVNGGAYPDHAVFTNLGYRVPLGAEIGSVTNPQRTLFVAYDVAAEAQINPRITVGAEFTHNSKIMPRLPGTVQERVRVDANPGADNPEDMYNFGVARFPIASNTALVMGYPDRLVITPSQAVAPDNVSQGQTDVPILNLNCAVNPGTVGDPRAAGSVRIGNIRVDQSSAVGMLNAVTELTNCRLYYDANSNGKIDVGTEPAIAESTFTTLAGTNGQATFTNLDIPVVYGTPKNLILAASITSGATLGSKIRFEVQFAPTPGPQPQANCYVQLLNNTSEPDNNKDFVEWDTATRGATWPMTSKDVTVITPNQPPLPPTAGFAPTGGAQISDDTPTLSWNAGSDPDTADTPDTLHYEVELSTSATFATITASGTTAANTTTFDITTPLTRNQTYYWRVWTVDSHSARSTNPSTAQSFQVVDNRPPNAVAAGGVNPADAADITDQTPDLSWTPTTDPDAEDLPATLTYEVQVDDEDQFQNPMVFAGDSALGTASINVTATLQVGVTYYWRVRARDSKGATLAWGTATVHNFRVVANKAPAAPIAAFSPANGIEINSANPLLQWNMPNPPDPNTTSDTLATLHWEVQLKANSDLATGPYVFSATTANGVLQALVDTANLLDDVHYYFRVRTVDAGGLVSPWSATQDFWVNLANDAPGAVAPPYSPTSGTGINDSTPTLSWGAATDPDATDTSATLAYEVTLWPDGAGTPTYTYRTLAGVTTLTVPTVLSDVTTWHWSVRAIDNDGAMSATGPDLTFNLNTANQLPAAPTSGFLPTGGVNVSTLLPKLQWDAGTDAEDAAAALAYDLEISDDATFAPTATYYRAIPRTAGKTTYQLQVADTLTLGQTYYWRVRTVDTKLARSPWTANQSFRTGGNQAPNAVTAGFSPTGNAAVSTLLPTFSWTATTDPDGNDTPATLRYNIQVDDNQDFSSTIFRVTTNPGVTTYTSTTNLTLGVTYWWRIQAQDAATLKSAWSAPQQFNIVANRSPFSPQAPFAPTPSGTTVTTAQPVLQWAMPAVPDPDSNDTLANLKYQIQLNTSATFAGGPYLLDYLTAAGAPLQLPLVITLTDDQTYYWRVRATDAAGACSPWITPQSFAVNAVNDAPVAPTKGFTPPDGYGTTDTTPTLSWDNSTDPDPDPTDDATNVSYLVQLSTDSTFTTTGQSVASAVGTPTVTVPTALTDRTTWFWRVQTIDQAGARSPFSQVQSLIVNSTNQAPTAPSSGFIFSGGQRISTTTPRLRWDPSTDANDTTPSLFYDVEVSTDAGFAAGATYNLALTSIAGQAYVNIPVTDPLTVGSTYFWRVRAVDPKHLRSAWSGTQQFSVGANQAPNAPDSGFTPISGVGISDPTPVLAWNAATDPDANDTASKLRYTVQLDDNTNFSSVVFTGTSAVGTTSVTCTTTLSQGVDYYWRVRTIDEAGATSAWATYAALPLNFRIIENRQPNTPIANFDPARAREVTTANPTLSWNVPNPPNPADPDPNDTIDTIDYEVQLKAGADLSTGPYSFSVTTTNKAQQISVLSASLTDNTRYYWRVRAKDTGGLTSDWSAIQNFWVNTSNQPPVKPDSGFTPANGGPVGTLTPTLSWNPASDPDPTDPSDTLSYVVELSLGSGFATVAYQYTVGPNVTNVTVTTPLTDRKTWYWRVRAVDDDGAPSPWSDTQNFALDSSNQPPTFLTGGGASTVIVTPEYGDGSTFFQVFVTYTDAENDLPNWVQCTFGPAGLALPMNKVVPGDNNARDGIQYVVGVTAAQLGLGPHGLAFTCDLGVRYPATGTVPGPVVGTPSTLQFETAGGTPTASYEENGTVYLRVRDQNRNLDPLVAETIGVTVAESNASNGPGSDDSETALLTETGPSTGVFVGPLPTLGQAGSAGDGVLNAVGGTPAGNQLTATYADPADQAGPSPNDGLAPNTALDTRSLQATLRDTVAPANVGALLQVTSGPDGRTADLDWGTYDEAAQGDVVGYHIWFRTSTFSSVNWAPLDSVPAGTQTYNAVNLLPNRDYFFAVTAYDEVPNERKSSVTAIKVTTADTSSPTVTWQTPTANAVEQPLDTSITFLLADRGIGLDLTSVTRTTVTLEQNGVGVAIDPLIKSGDAAQLTVTVKPTSGLAWNGTEVVKIDVKDLSGNPLTTQMTFYTLSDTGRPIVDTQTPQPNATNVPVSTGISFHIKDATSGVNQSSILVRLNGVDISSQIAKSGTPADTTVSYDPPVDLLYNTHYTLEVTVADVAGNIYGPMTWSFDTALDGVGVQIDQVNPADGATNVPVDTDVSFRLTDQQSGIDLSSLQVLFRGVDVTSSCVVTPTPAAPAIPVAAQVTYNPPADLPYAADMQLRVRVQDRVLGTPNVTDQTYTFRTVDAPLFNIAGLILDPGGNAVPGITVTAGGRTDVTDGNGAYRVSGLLAGNYTVTPSSPEYTFAPTSLPASVGPDDANNINFTATLKTYEIRGTVREGGVGLAGVTITWGTTGAVTTGAGGTFIIPNLPNGTYTVLAAMPNYHFDPTSQAVTIAGASVLNRDFTAIPDTFNVSGIITDSVGNRLQGVGVSDGGAHVAVSNSAGQYILTGLRAGTYNLRAAKVGYVLNPAPLSVTVGPDKTDANFTAYVEISNSFSRGLNFIGVPGTPVDPNPLSVFQNALCYRWNPDARPAAWVVAQNDPTAAMMQVRPGRGFFVQFGTATTLSVAGVPTDTSRQVSLGLGDGWNMIANPMPGPTPLANFLTNVTGTVRPFAYVYDSATGSYLLVTPTAAVGAARTTILPWEGAWVRALGGGASLLVTASASAAVDSKPQAADLNGGWTIPVIARAGGRADLSSVAGMVPGASSELSIENPPPAPASVDVYFEDTAGNRLATDIRSQDATQKYEFVVSCGLADVPVTVSLPDLSNVPADKQVLLVDKDGGKTVYARTVSSYSYQSRGEGGQRHFELVVEPRNVGALSIQTASAATQAGGVMFTYSLSKAAAVEIRVLNMAGRCVRTVVADKVVSAGLQTEAWNLMSDTGTRVPSGTYLLQIEATADNGQRVRSLSQVRVSR